MCKHHALNERIEKYMKAGIKFIFFLLQSYFQSNRDRASIEPSLIETVEIGLFQSATLSQNDDYQPNLLESFHVYQLANLCIRTA